MVIFKADTDESSIQTFVNRLEKMANEADGTLEKLDKWGVRRFAYEINKAREGLLRGAGVPRPQRAERARSNDAPCGRSDPPQVHAPAPRRSASSGTWPALLPERR